MTSLLDRSPVVPVVVVDDVATAVPLARALARGGIPIIEVTLRSDAALDAIRAIAAHVPEMTLGAGTVCNPEQVKLAVEAGAQFLVSPGATDRLLDALQGTELPFLAGTAVGILPGTIAAVYVGDRLLAGITGSDKRAFVVAGVVVAALFALSFAPTLIKKLPLPLRRFIGDLSERDMILVGLDVKAKK